MCDNPTLPHWDHGCEIIASWQPMIHWPLLALWIPSVIVTIACVINLGKGTGRLPDGSFILASIN